MTRWVKMGIGRHGWGVALTPLLRYLFYKKSPLGVKEKYDTWGDPVESVSFELKREVPEEDIWIEYLRDVLARHRPEIDSRNVSFVTLLLSEHDPSSTERVRSPVLEITLEEENNPVALPPEEKEDDQKHASPLNWLKTIVYPCEDAIRIWCEDLKMSVEQGHARKVHEDWHLAFNHVFYECPERLCQRFSSDWQNICYMDKYWDWKTIYDLHKDTFDKWGIKPRLKKEKKLRKT